MYSCGTIHYSVGDMMGTYTQMEEDSLKSYIDLTFNKTGFTLVDETDHVRPNLHSKPFFCCDTIAYGTWKLDNKHGVLSLSTPQLTDTYIDDNVQEGTNPNADFLYFSISNPIEKDMAGGQHGNIFYTFDLYSTGGDLGDNLTGSEFNTNKIVINNPQHSVVQNFSINIYTKPDFYARYKSINPVKTFRYTVKNSLSNSFRIDIPKLTYGYFTYLRLKEHLIKIVDKDELIWDGVKYKRK